MFCILIILSGSSGVGKNTIINKIISDSFNFELMPTITTRKMRDNEKPGNPYWFISDDEFKQMITNDELYEYENIHGSFYGTSKKILDECFKSEKVLLKDIDVSGTLKLMHKLGSNFKIISIFLTVPSIDVLKERLTGRKEKEIKLRLARFEYEQKMSVKYNYILVNNNLDETISIIYHIASICKIGEHPKSTLNIQCINEKKINEIAAAMNQNEDLLPIEVTFFSNSTYIIDGHHRYLASILTGKRIAQKYISAKHVDEYEQNSWLGTIEYFESMKN